MPLTVLQQAQANLLCDSQAGMSILEMSHRSDRFQNIIDQARQHMIDLYQIPDTHEVLFLQGGASLQFAMIPLNLGPHGAYINTGTWSTRALAEARLQSESFEVWSSQATHFDQVPSHSQAFNTTKARYLHYTSNNTIYGTQFHAIPGTDLPLICDMSSDIFSRPLNIENFDLIYAGAQKNAGPAGVSIVIVNKKISRAQPYYDTCPHILRYKTHADKGSLYHTPNVFGIYVLSLMGQWLKDQGGLEKINETNVKKANMIYEIIDEYPHVFVGHAHKDSRSLMNVTFNVGHTSKDRDQLTHVLKEELIKNQLQGCLGHRSVGGFRVSLYNSISIDSVSILSNLLRNFAQKSCA